MKCIKQDGTVLEGTPQELKEFLDEETKSVPVDRVKIAKVALNKAIAKLSGEDDITPIRQKRNVTSYKNRHEMLIEAAKLVRRNGQETIMSLLKHFGYSKTVIAKSAGPAKHFRPYMKQAVGIRVVKDGHQYMFLSTREYNKHYKKFSKHKVPKKMAEIRDEAVIVMKQNPDLNRKKSFQIAKQHLGY